MVEAPRQGKAYSPREPQVSPKYSIFCLSRREEPHVYAPAIKTHLSRVVRKIPPRCGLAGTRFCKQTRCGTEYCNSLVSSAKSARAAISAWNSHLASISEG